jgi:hypothetical protein
MRTAVRRGAAWPAKRPSSCLSWRWSSPVRRSVIPLVVVAAELSWLVDRPDASAQPSVQRPSSGQDRRRARHARTPAMASVAGPRPAWVSTHPVPSSGARLSGPSSVRSARCPVTWARRPGSGVRPSGVHPSGVRPSGVAPVRPDVSVWSPSGGGIGDRPMRQGNPHHGSGPRSLWAAASSSGSGRRPSRPGRGRRRRGHPWSAGLSVVDPGRVGRGRRPCLTLASRVGQAACGAPVAGGCARAREEAAPAARLPFPGWVGDHCAWLSRRLAPTWTGPEGPMGLPAGMGVRPQRGPGSQRVLPACCRQRSDLRRWLVGLPGLEPGTSSLSAKYREPLCGRLFSQVARDRRGRS